VSDPSLTSLLEEHASAHEIPGAALGVLGTATPATACHGLADMTTGEAVTEETRFAPGSLVKWMVATALVRLAAAGALSLDDAVAHHVPELAGASWAERASVRDLLANRSGLPLSSELEFDGFPGEDDDVLSRFASAVATREPAGAFWSYSNAGWCLAGRVLETVTGAMWEDAMRTSVLAPLGMDGTTFVASPVAEPRATGYEVSDGDAAPAEPWTPRAIGPAGSTMLATVTDLLRLADAHLSDPILAEMRVPHAETRIPGWIDRWCLGCAQLDWDGGPVWGWDGVLSGQRAFLRIVPGRGAVVLMTNGSNGRALYRSLFPLLMEELGVRVAPLALQPSADAAGDLSRFEGVYAWPDTRYEVAATGKGLTLATGAGTVEALPIDDRTFLLDPTDDDWPTITFDGFDAEGRPGVLYTMLWGLPRHTA
jgi:CubicO group peptidase (beta-lactamase class C family)